MSKMLMGLIAAALLSLSVVGCAGTDQPPVYNEVRSGYPHGTD